MVCIIRRVLPHVAALAAIPASYAGLLWLLIKARGCAGVAQDSGTAVDCLASLGCIAAASAIAGMVARTVFRNKKLGIGLAIAVLLASVGQVVLFPVTVFSYEGISSVMGDYSLVAFLWALVGGLSTGWISGYERHPGAALWLTAFILAVTAAGIWSLVYFSDRYLIEVFG